MSELYYREIHVNSDGSTREGGTRSHPVFDMKYPMYGVKFIALKNLSLPITWYNSPDPETITIDIPQEGGGFTTFTFVLPAGQYSTDEILAIACINLIQSFWPNASLDYLYNVPGVEGKIRWRWTLNSLSPFPFRITFSPNLKRLLGYRTNYEPIVEPTGYHISENMTRVLEPFEIFLRSSLMSGNMNFSNIVVGAEQANTSNVFAKIPLPASTYDWNSVYLHEHLDSPTYDHMIPYSTYSDLKRFDMFFTTSPTKLYPNGREIDFNGYPFSATICLLCTTVV
jgi:hypothetical protein